MRVPDRRALTSEVEMKREGMGRRCPTGCTCRKHTPTEEHRRNLSEARRGKRHSEETRRRISKSRRGKTREGTALGFYMQEGYVMLTMQGGIHPLADANGTVFEHRKILYDAVGPDSQACTWCGKTLSWGGIHGIQVDHLNGVRDDNRVENLVVSCRSCNYRRAVSGNSTEWARK